MTNWSEMTPEQQNTFIHEHVYDKNPQDPAMPNYAIHINADYDDDYEDWKVGDSIIWEEEKGSFPTPFQIAFVDELRVCWKENGKEVGTRTTNMLRVKKKESTR